MIRTDNPNGNILLSLEPEIDRAAKQVARKCRLEPAELANEFWVRQLGSSKQLQLVDGRLPNLASRLHNCAKDMLRREPVNRLRRKTSRKSQGPTECGQRSDRYVGIPGSIEPLRDSGDNGKLEARLQSRIEVNDVIEQLAPGDCEFIRMRYQLGLTCPEISQRTGQSLECVKSRRRRTEEKCFPQLQKELS